MTSIDRRDFLRTSAAAGGGLALPAWLTLWFEPAGTDVGAQGKAGAGDRESARLVQLRKAERRAAARGKPLLVFVVPADPALRTVRGKVHGALLNHGGRGVLLDLALCELACATIEEIDKVMPRRKLSGEPREDPLMLLIEPPAGARPRSTTAIAPDLSGLAAPPRFGAAGTIRAFDEASTKHVTQRNALIAAALRDAVAADRGKLQLRENAVRATLADDEREVLDAWIAGTGAAPTAAHDAVVLRAAAVLRFAAASRRTEDGRRLLDTITAAAERVLVRAEVPGSKWATTDGCGMRIEGQRGGLAVACGMGAVPPLEKRFLYFFTGA